MQGVCQALDLFFQMQTEGVDRPSVERSGVQRVNQRIHMPHARIEGLIEVLVIPEESNAVMMTIESGCVDVIWIESPGAA